MTYQIQKVEFSTTYQIMQAQWNTFNHQLTDTQVQHNDNNSAKIKYCMTAPFLPRVWYSSYQEEALMTTCFLVDVWKCEVCELCTRCTALSTVCWPLHEFAQALYLTPLLSCDHRITDSEINGFLYYLFWDSFWLFRFLPDSFPLIYTD